MCGRFSIFTPEEALRQLFDYGGVPRNLAPRYNIAPTQDVPLVRVAADRRREMIMAHWGLIPAWSKDRSAAARMINARAETVAEKPSFRSAFRKRRCLIPADGFYEWRQEGDIKQPYRIAFVDDAPFAFAGLWEHWPGSSKEPDDGSDNAPVDSCTILTTEANAQLAAIHTRMPVILDPADYAAWLDVENTPIEAAQALLRSDVHEGMRIYRVSRYVSNPRNDGPKCIEPDELV